ncbi:MAG: ArsR family transcriptional regulator [Candidatus Heimdallarchaeota archaeon]|nr:ArsR family transcriptional regulator [Candidatus Heimdallarchaeota archaeon]
MTDPDQIFLALKSSTRRKILAMLASEPMYLTQLSTKLSLGQQAIFRHLQMLEDAGLLESNFREAGQGPPRRYYKIASEFRVEVQISPELFDVGLFSVPRLEIQKPEGYPELTEIVTRFKELRGEPHSKRKLSELSELLDKLGEELDKINIAKSVAEATYSNIRRQIRQIAFALLPQRIDQRIIQTLASRGCELKIEDLALILNLSEETIRERLEDLQKAKLVHYEKGKCRLL